MVSADSNISSFASVVASFRQAMQLRDRGSDRQLGRDARAMLQDLIRVTTEHLQLIDRSQRVYAESVGGGEIATDDEGIAALYRVAGVIAQTRLNIIEIVDEMRSLGETINVPEDFSRLTGFPEFLTRFLADMMADIEEIGPPPENYGDPYLDAINSVTNSRSRA